jgi:hypothetical protein
MNSYDKTKVIDLLMKREAAFLAIHEAESQVEKIVGQPFPFSPPPDLPSLRKTSKTAPKKTQRVKIRNLQPPEVAYRITYQQHGEQCMELHTNIRLVRRVVDTMSTQTIPDMHLIRIETIMLSDHHQDAVCETLFDQNKT